MTTRPEDIADMFDLPPEPAAASSTAEATAAAEAAEAALAAELLATIESGGFADDAPESRTNLRVDVSWPARMTLPSGRVIGLRVRNISGSGVGLMGDEDIPSDTVVRFEMDVPQPDDAGEITPVKGTIKTTYAVGIGAQILCGATWVSPPAGFELLDLWIRQLRR